MKQKIEVIVVFGEEAVREYWNEEGVIPVSKLNNLGHVIRREFNTESELKAYLNGVDDTVGWHEYCEAEDELIDMNN